MDSNVTPATQSPHLHPGEWGQIEILPAPADHPFGKLNAIEVTLHRWTPSSGVQSLFPPGHRLEFWCVRGSDGLRRFLPKMAWDVGYGPFLLNAAAGGIAVLERPWQTATAEKRSDNCNYYRLRHLIYQWSFNRKRGLNREFHRLEDIALRSNERPDDSVSTIIPEWAFWEPGQIEAEPLPQDEQLRRLTGEGRAEAARLGRSLEDEGDLINFGIIGLARKDPLDVNGSASARALELIRKSVWEDYELSSEPAVEIKDEVEDRIWDSFRKHNHLSTDAFHQWFYKDLDNLVGQISKRNRNNRRISRDQVNRALGELVWEGYLVISDFVECQMRMFKAALSEPLTPDEQKWFDACYRAQPRYGGLIPLMLHSQFQLLKPILVESLEGDSDGSLEATVVTSVLVHTEMVNARREADKRSKNNTSVGRAKHRATQPAFVEPVNIEDLPVACDGDEDNC